MSFKTIISVLFFSAVYINFPGTAFSQSQTIPRENQDASAPGVADSDAALFQKYVDSIQNFSIPARIEILKRFIELHPENRYVPQVKDMLAEYSRLVNPEALRDSNQPPVKVRPPVPTDKSPMPPGVPAAETIEALPRHKVAPPASEVSSPPKIEPPDDGKTYSSGYSEGFRKGYDRGKKENSGFGAGVAVGIVGTIVGEILLVLLIVAGN